MVVPETQEENVWDVLHGQIQGEIEQTKKQLDEIVLLLQQSQLEVGKLSQRNASITANLQRIQGQFDSLPRGDIRMAYDSALDAQQRLFVMRGQLEKLQSDQQHIQRYLDFLERVGSIIESGQPNNTPAKGAQSMAETVEIMIEAQESERLRLSRQMHDGPAQALSNFILQTEIAMRLFDLDQARAREELSNLKISATSAFQKVRDFIFELRPMMLDDLGLAPTIKRFIDALQDHPGLEIRLLQSGTERRFEPYIEVMVFRAVQELVTNAVRHSQATQIKVQLDMGDTNIKVAVEDNGKGFDVGVLEERGGMGIKVIKERVEKLGGYLDVDSVPGRGARITFQIPAPHVGQD
jgi:two-component system sensor histidine kinase DegS